MKKNAWIKIVVLAVIMIAAVCVSRAGAQIPNPNDVLRYGSATGDYWGESRNIRCRNAMLYEWLNPGERMPSSCVALMTTVPRYAQYNNQPGGFFNRQGGLFAGGGNVFQSSCIGNDCGSDWEYVAGTVAREGFGYLRERSQQETIRQGQDHTADLTHREIDLDMTKEANDYSIRSGQERRTDQRLVLELERGRVELEQFKNGRYVSKPLGPRKPRTVYNRSDCQLNVFYNDQLASVLPPNGSVLIFDGQYRLESTSECHVTVNYEGDNIHISDSGR